MIKKLTSEQFMNILEDAQNSISDTKIQVENIKTEIENKMNVINNVFAGAETKFTEDTTDTDHLKINNNVYIG